MKYQHPRGRGERVRKASPINTRRGAEEYERQIRHALLTGSFGKEKQNETGRVPTFGEFVPRFITYSENNKLFKTDKPAFDFLSFEEAERLINAAEPEWRTLILLALKTGLRHGELIGLQWGDVDLQRGKLQVRSSILQG